MQHPRDASDTELGREVVTATKARSRRNVETRGTSNVGALGVKTV